MTVSTSTSPSRRALLAGALGGIAAAATAAAGRLSPARAADGGAVILGEANTAQSQTSIFNTTDADLGDAFRAVAHGAGWGVIGVATEGIGVRGVATSGPGISGFSETGIGAGGHSSSSLGVSGSSDTGTGVYGTSITGFGMVAESAQGVAFRARGRVRFSTSGVARIPAGTTSKVVTPGVNVSTAAFVLLTPKTNVGGRDLWFTTNPTADTFTIRMSSARSSGTNVAWLLLG